MAKRIRKVSKCRTHRRGFNRKTYKKKSYKNKTMRRKLYKRRTNKRRTKRLRKRMKGGFWDKDTLKVKFVFPIIPKTSNLELDKVYDRDTVQKLQKPPEYVSKVLAIPSSIWEIPNYTLNDLWEHIIDLVNDDLTLFRQDESISCMATWERSFGMSKETMGFFRIQEMDKTINEVFPQGDWLNIREKYNQYTKTLYILYYRKPPEMYWIPGDYSYGAGYYLSNGYNVHGETNYEKKPRGVYHVKKGNLVFTYYEYNGSTWRYTLVDEIALMWPPCNTDDECVRRGPPNNEPRLKSLAQLQHAKRVAKALKE